MRSEIDRCYKTVQGEIDDVDMAATVFREFGKGLVKKGNVSPDAFVQMAIQLANYRVLALKYVFNMKNFLGSRKIRAHLRSSLLSFLRQLSN